MHIFNFLNPSSTTNVTSDLPTIYMSGAVADPPREDLEGLGENEDWEFADDQKVLNEIHLSGTETKEEEGFVVKEILRTGEWPVIPTAKGLLRKPLKVVRDGVSDPEKGIISLSEVVANFGQAIERVQIPLSDDKEDHKNITRLNTGYVRDIWIVDEGEGSKLVAKMEFTEPDVKEKVLRGTYADVSCGIPWAVSSRGKRYGTTLEHVAITNRPFIDGLGPFLAASEKSEAEVEHFGSEEKPEETISETPPEVEAPVLSFSTLSGFITNQLSGFSYPGFEASDYEIKDISAEEATILNKNSQTTWTASFSVSGTEEEPIVTLSSPEKWQAVKEGSTEGTGSLGTGETIEPTTKGGSPNNSLPLDELEQARRLRELQFSQEPSTMREREENMPLTREELAALEMSDDARAAIQTVLDETAQLRASAREAEVDRRVDELKEMGLKERPGALKFYRQVALSDDGGPAAVVLSDDGNTTKERLTAVEILDRFIEGVKDDEGKLNLSDQALVSGNDDPPPADASGENKSVEERLAETREALYGSKK